MNDERGKFVLCVADDGAGMMPAATGGQLDIERQEGAGTRITVRLRGRAN